MSNATPSFTYTVKDDSGAESAAQTANITISGTNDAPQLTAGSISATEDQLGAGCMASPAVVENDLIVRTKTHCYRLGRAASPPSQ